LKPTRNQKSKSIKNKKQYIQVPKIKSGTVRSSTKFRVLCNDTKKNYEHTKEDFKCLTKKCQHLLIYRTARVKTKTREKVRYFLSLRATFSHWFHSKFIEANIKKLIVFFRQTFAKTY